MHRTSNVKIRYNWIHDTNGKGTENFMHAIEMGCGATKAGYSENNEIYANLIENIEDAGIRVKWSSKSNKIYNNIIINSGTPGRPGPQSAHIAFQSNLRSSGHGGIIKNNISLNPRAYHVYVAQDDAYSNLGFDNNLYFPGTGRMWYHAPDNSAQTWAEWRAESYSPDAHSPEPTDPLLQGKSPYERLSDFILRPGSPAIDAGLDLGDGLLCGLDPRTAAWPPKPADHDRFGNGWEIGAMVYGPEERTRTSHDD